MAIFKSEKKIIDNFIKENYTVVDIGANKGEWSRYVLENKNNIKFFLFEPNPVFLKDLEKIKNSKVFNMALSNKTGKFDFWIYNISELSGLFRRPREVEEKFNLGIPRKIEIQVSPLDNILDEKIDFIKIDSEGAEILILEGMKRLIEENKIKTIQIEYGSTYKENNFKIKQAFEILKTFPFVYRIFENSEEIKRIEKYEIEIEDYSYSNFVFSKEEYK